MGNVCLQQNIFRNKVAEINTALKHDTNRNDSVIRLRQKTNLTDIFQSNLSAFIYEIVTFVAVCFWCMYYNYAYLQLMRPQKQLNPTSYTF